MNMTFEVRSSWAPLWRCKHKYIFFTLRKSFCWSDVLGGVKLCNVVFEFIVHRDTSVIIPKEGPMETKTKEERVELYFAMRTRVLCTFEFRRFRYLWMYIVLVSARLLLCMILIFAKDFLREFEDFGKSSKMTSKRKNLKEFIWYPLSFHHRY